MIPTKTSQRFPDKEFAFLLESTHSSAEKIPAAFLGEIESCIAEYMLAVQQYQKSANTALQKISGIQKRLEKHKKVSPEIKDSLNNAILLAGYACSNILEGKKESEFQRGFAKYFCQNIAMALTNDSNARSFGAYQEKVFSAFNGIKTFVQGLSGVPVNGQEYKTNSGQAGAEGFLSSYTAMNNAFCSTEQALRDNKKKKIQELEALLEKVQKNGL